MRCSFELASVVLSREIKSDSPETNRKSTGDGTGESLSSKTTRQTPRQRRYRLRRDVAMLILCQMENVVSDLLSDGKRSLPICYQTKNVVPTNLTGIRGVVERVAQSDHSGLVVRRCVLHRHRLVPQ